MALPAHGDDARFRGADHLQTAARGLLRRPQPVEQLAIGGVGVELRGDDYKQQEAGGLRT